MDVLELSKSVNLVDYVGQYTELNQKGNEWVGLSPFRQERTPSLFVNGENNTFYDFGEGIGGGVIRFTERMFNCDYAEAVKKVAKYANVNPESLSDVTELSAVKSMKKFARKKRDEKLCNVTQLPNDYMDRYDPNAPELAEWQKEGISIETLRKFDVRYDEKSNRLCFPIRDCRDGSIINVSGRTLDPQFKEKSLKKYIYYHKFGSLDTLYGYWENQGTIKAKHEIILAEGAKSVMKFEEFKSFGGNNMCAILTSHLNYNQMRFLAQLGCTVVFALDKEIDVCKDKNIKTLSRFVRVEYIRDRNGLLGEKESPVDRGETVFRKLYEGRCYYR